MVRGPRPKPCAPAAAATTPRHRLSPAVSDGPEFHAQAATLQRQHLKRSNAGVIIIMSSVGGRFGYPNRSPYATIKRGLIALTETLAIELGQHGIRVNAIAPGAVEGDRIQRVLQGRAAATGRNLADVTADALAIQSLKWFVDPDDIAALAVFLASDQAKSISGQTIAIDGDSKAAQ